MMCVYVFDMLCMVCMHVFDVLCMICMYDMHVNRC